MNPALDVADVGERLGRARRRQWLGEDCRGERPTRGEVPDHRSESAAPVLPSLEHVEKLHRSHDQRKALRHRELADVVADDLDQQLEAPIRGPRLERIRQFRHGVDRNDPVAEGGEVEADPAGPGAEVQDRPPAAAGQRLPQRQVGDVVAAFGVMPGDGHRHRWRGDVHRQNSATRPRRASSVLRSINAV